MWKSEEMNEQKEERENTMFGLRKNSNKKAL